MCEQHNPKIERIFEDAMREVSHLAASVMAAIDDTANDVMLGIFEDHQWNLARIEQTEARAAVAAFISPYESIEQWFDSLTEGEQGDWYECYQKYMLAPGGDLMYEDDIVGQSVMDLLFSRDPYYKQPFCPHCDSRGHEPGACMPH